MLYTWPHCVIARFSLLSGIAQLSVVWTPLLPNLGRAEPYIYRTSNEPNLKGSNLKRTSNLHKIHDLALNWCKNKFSWVLKLKNFTFCAIFGAEIVKNWRQNVKKWLKMATKCKKIIFDIIFGRLFTLLQRISFSEPVREPTEPLWSNLEPGRTSKKSPNRAGIRGSTRGSYNTTIHQGPKVVTYHIKFIFDYRVSKWVQD